MAQVHGALVLLVIVMCLAFDYTNGFHLCRYTSTRSLNRGADGYLAPIISSMQCTDISGTRPPAETQ
jgi:hypothetical protein